MPRLEPAYAGTGRVASTPRPWRIRPWVEGIALALLGLAIGFVAIEGAVRLWVATASPNLFVLDDEIGWIHRPNARRTLEIEGAVALVETNGLGLRGPVHVGESARTRVLVLGDSFTEGMQVSNDDLFSTVWERARPDLEIVNAGVAGYGTVQETVMARRMAPVIRPDLTVVMVYGGNDLTDNVMPFDEALGPRPYVDRDRRVQSLDWEPFRPLLRPLPLSAWLYRHSLAAYALHKRFLASTPAHQAYVAQWKSSVPEDELWMVLEERLAELAAGRRLVVAALPTREQVAAGDVGFSRRLAQVAGRIGIAFVDLQPDLRPEHFFQRHDFHWNVLGHRAVGDRLAAAL